MLIAEKNTTSPLSPLTAMLLSNLTSHASLVPTFASLKIPVVPLLSQSTTRRTTFLRQHPPLQLSTLTIVTRIRTVRSEVGQEDERDIEAMRALAQAFEDGASEGVKEGKGKRKGECHFLASVFANISMVSGLPWASAIADALRFPRRDSFC